jgi:metal-sulfur cluster biosynthetic enzyme/nitrite reductase/ring-hydroxylating ferredoxin subunit
MSEFVRVAKTSDLSDPGQMLLEVEDRIVVLFRVGGEFYCLDDVCTHDGGPLSEGHLDDHTIACPRHGAKFDIRTGKALTMPATVDTAAHEVKVEGNDVLVRLCEPGELASKPSAPAATRSTPASDARLSSTRAEPSASAPAAAPATAASTSAHAISEDRVREELKNVVDPELFINIVDLGLIYNVDLLPMPEGKTNCKIEMTMTSPMCPAGPQLIANSKQVLSRIDGMGEVEVKIILDPPWTPDKMTQEARDQLGIF